MISPGYDVPRSEVEAYIVEAAQARGVDPKIALEVYRREGAGAWQSTATTKQGTRENAWGPYQLYTDGGLGNKFQKDTGLDPRDPNTWKENVNYALDNAITGGWGPWYGAKAAGITGKAGINPDAKPLGWQAGPRTDMSGIFDTVADPTEAAAPTDVSSQRRTMPSMPFILGGGQSQGMPSMLSGLFNDPQKLAAMEMIVRSLNPWSNVGNSLSKTAIEDRRYKYEQFKEQRDYDLRREVVDTNKADKDTDNKRADKNLQRQLDAQGLTEIAKHLIQRGFVPGTPEYREEYKKKSDESKVFGTPIHGEVDGKPAVGTFDNHGKFRPIDTGTFRVAPDVKIVNTPQGSYAINSKGGGILGGGSAPVDPTQQPMQPGQTPGFYPNDHQAKEAAEAEGKIRGQANVALPGAERTTSRALRMLEEVEKHPGLSEAVGFIAGRLPALTPKGADFRERIEQVDAMVFGDAVEVMRGLGALTDREGPKITAARARLKTAKNEDDFRTALKDVRDVFNDGIANMRERAGKTAPTGGGGKRLKYNASTGELE
jgi:hypothetical protein